jgi:hypothetical protein
MTTHWNPSALLDAIRLLKCAHGLLDTTYPHAPSAPNPGTLVAVNAAIDSALAQLKNCRPTSPDEEAPPRKGPASA